MNNNIHNIQVYFQCADCDQDIRAIFAQEQVSAVRCTECGRAYTLMKPTIGDEILLDWEQIGRAHV